MHATRLKTLPLFSGLSNHDLERVATWIDEVDLPAGKKLLAEGTFAYEFVVIEDGDRGREHRRRARQRSVPRRFLRRDRTACHAAANVVRRDHLTDACRRDHRRDLQGKDPGASQAGEDARGDGRADAPHRRGPLSARWLRDKAREPVSHQPRLHVGSLRTHPLRAGTQRGRAKRHQGRPRTNGRRPVVSRNSAISPSTCLAQAS